MNCPPHWFVYPMPEGEFSTGRCKKCGKKDVSRNWEPDSTTMYSKQNGGKNKKLTPGQAAFGHQSITQTRKPEGVAGKNGRVR